MKFVPLSIIEHCVIYTLTFTLQCGGGGQGHGLSALYRQGHGRWRRGWVPNEISQKQNYLWCNILLYVNLKCVLHSVCVVATLSYFYFTGRINSLSGVVGLPQLNYYLVPVIVRDWSISYWFIDYLLLINRFAMVTVVTVTNVCLQVIAVGSFVIASGFFNVYSMGVDTLFLCFCEFWLADLKYCCLWLVDF